MGVLEMKRKYVGEEMAVRFHSSPSHKDSLIVVIPGGPGLGSHYLDPFMSELVQRSGYNAGVLDLPNHGDSVIVASRLPVTYATCLDYVEGALKEMRREFLRIVLFGQSLGARLVFDLLFRGSLEISGVALMGFPYKFENSEKFAQKLKGLRLEDLGSDDDIENKFARNWRKILPFNLYRDVSSEQLELLCSGTKWSGNELLLQDTPNIEKVAQRARISSMPPISVFEGEYDFVVPDSNLNILKSMLPRASFHIIQDSGHFPMVEKPEETLSLLGEFLSRLEVVIN